MNVLSIALFRILPVCFLVCSVCFSSAPLANTTLAEVPLNVQKIFDDQKNIDQKISGQTTVLSSSAANMTAEMRWTIKREVMSKPGVMLDMADMTDNGYTWTSDVVWGGSGATASDQWYTAGFLFKRPRYKGVWLQYAFTLSSRSGEIAKFRRWYGGTTFR